MNMLKRLFAAVGLLALAASPAWATNCPAFTYTLTNGTTADANQVMANFNTLLNCSNNNLAHNGVNSDITQLSAVTTPMTVPQGGTGLASGTSGGIPYFSGATSIASTAALTANSLILGGGPGAAPTALGAATNGQIPIGHTGSSPTLATITAGTGINVTNGTGTITISTSGAGTTPTTQTFTSGSSATYTTPANVVWLRVRIVGGGGGGGGVATSGNTGGTGGTTTFGSTTAIGGAGGSGSSTEVINAGGAGGSGGTTGTGNVEQRLTGAPGGPGLIGSNMCSGYGASSFFGGGATPACVAAGIGVNTSNGNTAVTNTGGGGSGAANTSTGASGGGGGAGEYVEFLISSPAATYTYTVGAGGTAGTGSQTGGVGAAGEIVVEEHYGS